MHTTLTFSTRVRSSSRVRHYLRNFLQLLPLMFLLLFMFFPPFVYVIGKINQHICDKTNEFLRSPPLHGIQETKTRPKLTPLAFYNRTFQEQFENWFGFDFPLRPFLVRLNNQIYYAVFSKSYMYTQRILVGGKNYLYEQAYVDNYTNSSRKKYNSADFEKWANDLYELKNFFEARGQQFIYLITPSKASYYEEYLPEEYAHVQGERRPDYFLRVAALQKKGIPFIDGSKITLDAKAQYGSLLFPQGGTHWTELAAAFTTQELIKCSLKNQKTGLNFFYTINHQPKGRDSDLLELLNLLRPEQNYLVPKLHIHAVADSARKKKIVFIGGSFTESIHEILAKSNHFSQIDYYRYFILEHKQISKNEIRTISMNNANPYKEVFSDDIVVLEENEAFSMTNHFKEFYKMIFKKVVSGY